MSAREQRFNLDPHFLPALVTIYAIPLDSDSITTRVLAEIHGFDVDYLVLNEDYDLRELHQVSPYARTFPQIVFDGFLVGDGHDFVDFINDSSQEEDYWNRDD